MDLKPTYEDLEIKINELKSELDKLKEVERTLEKERYYLHQAQEIGSSQCKM